MRLREKKPRFTHIEKERVRVAFVESLANIALFHFDDVERADAFEILARHRDHIVAFFVRVDASIRSHESR